MKQTNGIEFMADLIENEITDFKNPQCNNCNECCTIMAIVKDDEFKKIKKFLNSSAGKDIFKKAQIKFKSNFRTNNTINLMCPFSNKNKKCDIYNIRPKVCRDFHCSPNLNKEINRECEFEHKTVFDFFKRR